MFMDKKTAIIIASLIVLIVLLGVYFLRGFNFKSYIDMNESTSKRTLERMKFIERL